MDPKDTQTQNNSDLFCEGSLKCINIPADSWRLVGPYKAGPAVVVTSPRCVSLRPRRHKTVISTDNVFLATPAFFGWSCGSFRLELHGGGLILISRKNVNIPIFILKQTFSGYKRHH